VGQDRDPLSLVSTIEELLGRKGSGYVIEIVIEIREYGRGDPSRLFTEAWSGIQREPDSKTIL
jgi:hypothetical protein